MNLNDNQLTKLRHIMSEAKPGEHIAESELFDEVCGLAWQHIDLRVRAERAEAELAQVRRRIGEWAERLDTHDSHGDGAENADRRLLKVIEEMWGSARSVSPDPTTALSGPAGAAHTEEET